MLELQPHESTFALLADLMVTSARGTRQPLLLPDPKGEHTQTYGNGHPRAGELLAASHEARR